MLVRIFLLLNIKLHVRINSIIQQKDNIVIDEDQSKGVQKIYELYLNGYSILAIIRYLEEECIKSPTGKEQWAKRTIDTMLSNEKYTITENNDG